MKIINGHLEDYMIVSGGTLDSELNRSFNSLNCKWRMVLEALDYDTQGKRILDLGCGAESRNVESVKHVAE